MGERFALPFAGQPRCNGGRVRPPHLGQQRARAALEFSHKNRLRVYYGRSWRYALQVTGAFVAIETGAL